MSQLPSASAGDVVYAGFLRRWAAIFLDNLILTAGFYALFFVVILALGAAEGFTKLGRGEEPVWLQVAIFALLAVYYVGAGAYYTLMESSAAQATLGKQALGIKVTDLDGNRLTPQHALARWFAAALSYMTLYIGFLLAAFTERKQALHDLLAGTLVVDKWAYTDTPERQQRQLSGCLIAFMVVVGLMIVIAVLGILAAIAIPAYQDYTQRARVSEAIYSAAPLKMAVSEAALSGEGCPNNASEGFKPASNYATQYVQAITVDQLVDGTCIIDITLADQFARDADEPTIRLSFTPATQEWRCTSGLRDSMLPASCR